LIVKLAVCKLAAAISFLTFGACVSVAESETDSVDFSYNPQIRGLQVVVLI